MNYFSSLIARFNEKWPVEYSRKAWRHEYRYKGQDLTKLLKERMAALYREDPFYELAGDIIGSFLKKPILIPSYFIEKTERDALLKQLHDESLDLYTLFMERRNSTKHLERIIGILEIVFPKEHREFKKAIRELLDEQRHAIGTTEDVIECTKRTTDTIRQWCIEFVTAPVL